MNKKFLAPFSLLLFSSCSCSLYAATTALTFDGTTPLTIVSSGTFGWSFSVGQAISITHLAYYDFGNDGLSESHGVAVYQEGASGSSGINVIIPLGSTADIIEKQFHFMELTTPAILAAGNYRIGGFRSSALDAIISSVKPPGIVTTPEVEYIAGVFSSDDSGISYPLTTPTTFQKGFFGPNFKYEVVKAPTIPAPSALMLIFSGLGFIGIRKKCLVL